MCIGSFTLCTSYNSLGSYSSTDELNCDFIIESLLPLAFDDIVLKPLLLSIIYKLKLYTFSQLQLQIIKIEITKKLF